MYSFINKPLNEGLKEQELRDLIHDEIHIDEFQAKMGDDDQIIVVSFKVKYRAAAADLESFLEKGYDIVLDAEAGKAEFQDGWYLVFVEFERRLTFPEQLMLILKELKNISNVDKWKFRYGASRKRNVPEWELTVNNLKRIVPMSPQKYREIHTQEEEETLALESMLTNSNIKRTPYKDLTKEQYEMRMSAGLAVNGFKILDRGRR